MPKLTHFDSRGNAHMVDVSQKQNTDRIAVAKGWISMQPETLDLITQGLAKKGDVLGVARLAGIMAAKKTAEIIPLVTHWQSRKSLSTWRQILICRVCALRQRSKHQGKPV